MVGGHREFTHDAVGDAFNRLITAAGFKPSFRQLWKVGWNAMKKFWGRMVAGIAKWHQVDEFEDVMKTLKQWRLELVH